MRSALSLLGIGLLVVAACAPAAPAPSPAVPGAPAAPVGERRAATQSLRVAQVGLPANMSPGASASNTNVYGLMYDNLITLDSKFNILPGVAEKWEAPNPTTWRLTLRKDMTFSNGDKLNADDVEFTWKTFSDNKWPGAAQLPAVSDVKKVDDNTVDILLKAQDASMLANLGFIWILPRAYITRVGLDGFIAKPIGSGPYELAEYRATDTGRFTLRAAPHPFRKPIVTEITVRSLPEFTTISAGLRNGELDMAIGQFSGDQIDVAKKADVNVAKQYVYNINGAFTVAEREARNLPTKDKKVRQAINYAVDKEGIAKLFFKGEAIPAGQVGMPDAPFWDPNLKPYPYDPAMAKKLLADAGYPNGFKMEGGLEFTPQTANPDMMTAISGNLRDVGIDAPAKPYELATFLDKLYGRNGQSKGDVFFTTLGDGNGFDTLGRTFYGCTGLAWYCNPEFDQLHTQAAAEPDIQKRTALLRKAADLMVDDVSHLYLLVVPSFAISSVKIKAFDYPGIGARQFDTAYKVE